MHVKGNAYFIRNTENVSKGNILRIKRKLHRKRKTRRHSTKYVQSFNKSSNVTSGGSSTTSRGRRRHAAPGQSK
jgi:hypothetical protein